MRILKIFLLLLLGVNTLVLAQERALLLEAQVVDEQGQAIAGVNVSIEGNYLLGTATDEAGFFQLPAFELPLRLLFSHINFETTIIEVSDQVPLAPQIVLKGVIQALPNITVRAKNKIEVVYPEPYSITDYVFYQDRLLLLACKNTFDGFSLVLLDQEEKVLEEYDLRQWRPRNLYRSCSGTLYLITAARVLPINIENDQIKFGPSIYRELFTDGMENCVYANDSLVYYQRYYYQGQALQYYSLPRGEDDTAIPQQFPLIEDDRNIVLLIEEAGYRMPWSGNVWQTDVSPRLKVLRGSRYKLTGMWKVFYPPLNAPLYPQDSLICIFNHFSSQLEYFDKSGNRVREQAIDYHQQKKWSKKIYFDHYREEAYTSFRCDEGARFYPINMKTGALGAPTTIPMHFIEKVQIWNGYLYYLYRNRGKQERNRRLHRIRIY